MTTRQYARLASDWVACIGLDPKLFGTHSIRRTKATLIYRRTGNLRAVQLLLGHTKIESTASERRARPPRKRKSKITPKPAAPLSQGPLFDYKRPNHAEAPNVKQEKDATSGDNE